LKQQHSGDRARRRRQWFQARRLADGSTHLVLKNFPPSELRSLVADLGEHAAFTSWSYYWAFQYRVA
jgi:demethylmenaquinone methyltransferase/2-methoxy-6-polyprenyl-1,4-benzoquinol methylase